jgi:acetylornithine deacetylase/succinyl-diaminopimelate desuccinylase-like protein
VTPVVEGFLRALAAGAPFPQSKIMPLLLSPTLAGTLLDLLAKQNLEQALGIDAMLRNTASPTMLEAGNKVNVIPSSAKARIDGRVLPGQTVEQFLAEVQRVVGPDAEIHVFEQHDGIVFPTSTPLYDAITSVLRRRDPEATAVPYMITGFTDSFAYARLGATCYGFAPVKLGPELNFIRMYHGHDERIPIDGFRWGLETFWELVRDFCAARCRIRPPRGRYPVCARAGRAPLRGSRRGRSRRRSPRLGGARASAHPSSRPRVSGRAR